MRRHLTITLGVLASQALLGCAPASTTQQAHVVSIGDGDTIRVRLGEQGITVRLACIDVPEMAQAPYGAQARSYLQTRLRVGSTVKFQPKTIDRYGRTVAELWALAGILVRS